MDDDMLLKAILDLDLGNIANVVQAASEVEGTLSERLSYAFYEITNRDDGGNDMIRLKD